MSRTKPRVRVYIPSLEEVHVLVQRAIQDGIAIDHLANYTLFPEGSPRSWGDWPAEAKDAWQGIVAMYSAERRAVPAPPLPAPPRPSGGRPTTNPELSLAQVWHAVMASMDADASLRLTWPDLSARLGVTRRVTQYQMLGRLGFAFRGPRGQRLLTSAPCLRCAEQKPYADLRDCLCRECST